MKVIPKQPKRHLAETQPMAGEQPRVVESLICRPDVRRDMIIVFNPVAGMRRASLLWRVLDVLVANGIRIELAETHRAGHAEALAREAVCGGASMVVAAGGDGTIAEVANGLLGSAARARGDSARHRERRGARAVAAVRAARRGGGARLRPDAAALAGRGVAAPRDRGCSCRCSASGSTRRWCITCRSV